VPRPPGAYDPVTRPPGAVLENAVGSHATGRTDRRRPAPVARPPGTDSASYVAGEAAKWVGPLLVLTFVGVLVALVASARGRVGRADLWLALVLFAGGLLAPVDQARIHTWLSLRKHVGFGAWFACIVAGLLLARIFAALRDKVHVVAGVLVTAPVVGPPRPVRGPRPRG
jgi:hypothetical protein